MSKEDDVGREDDNENDKHQLKKHKKKIQWMIGYVEGKAGRGGIADEEQTRVVIDYLEKLHDAVDEEVQTMKHGKDKKKGKERSVDDKKPSKD